MRVVQRKNEEVDLSEYLPSEGNRLVCDGLQRQDKYDPGEKGGTRKRQRIRLKRDERVHIKTRERCFLNGQQTDGIREILPMPSRSRLMGPGVSLGLVGVKRLSHEKF